MSPTYGSVRPSPAGSPFEDEPIKHNRSLKIIQVVLVSAVLLALAVVATSKIPRESESTFDVIYKDDESLMDVFEKFRVDFEKSYDSDEEMQKRFQIFRQNAIQIDQRNRAAVESGKNTRFAINAFADLEHEEWKKLILMDRATMELPTSMPGESTFDIDDCVACSRFPELSEYDADNLPESFDWRDYGAVTAVKNQVYCGSCWTFGTTGDIEGTWYLAGNDLINLSEQQLVACDTKYDFGCDGGWQEAAFEYIITKGGIVSEDTYPYLTVNMENVDSSPVCSDVVTEDNFAATISSWAYVSTSAETEDIMALALVRQGPLTIAINADPMDFYSSGIDDPDDCNPEDLNHAVLVVGYGQEDGVKYWTIKNSWAQYWGEDGYYRIVRGEDKCGLALEVCHSYV